MLSSSLRVSAVALITLGAHAAIAADAFPRQPVRILVNTAPGGLTDITARLLAQKMSDELGQRVVVENRAGGDGLIGIRAVKTAPADGYTLLGSAGTVAFQQVLRKDPGYDLTKDFAGVGAMGRSPFLVVVAPDKPDRSFGDLVARARAKPNALSYASAGTGTATHLGAALLLQRAGVTLLHVPYKGNGPAMPDVMDGRVDMILEAYGSSKGYLAARKLKALGVTSAKRLAAMPDVPTLIEQGVAGYEYYTWLCFLAPAGTPKEAIDRLASALHAAKAAKDVQERFAEVGMDAMDMSPAEFESFMAGEIAQVGKLIADLGLTKQ